MWMIPRIILRYSAFLVFTIKKSWRENIGSTGMRIPERKNEKSKRITVINSLLQLLTGSGIENFYRNRIFLHKRLSGCHSAIKCSRK
jgi:hypothetical protein